MSQDLPGFLSYGGCGRQDFWHYMDILLFTEATIYQMDEENEVLTREGRAPMDGQLQGQKESYPTI